MLEIIKGIFNFILEIMQKGFYVLPWIFAILFTDYLKRFYKEDKVKTETMRSFITLMICIVLNSLFVFANMMIITSVFKIKFNGWIYIFNLIGNSALSVFSVELVDNFQEFIKEKFSKK